MTAPACRAADGKTSGASPARATVRPSPRRAGTGAKYGFGGSFTFGSAEEAISTAVSSGGASSGLTGDTSFGAKAAGGRYIRASFGDLRSGAATARASIAGTSCAVCARLGTGFEASGGGRNGFFNAALLSISGGGGTSISAAGGRIISGGAVNGFGPGSGNRTAIRFGDSSGTEGARSGDGVHTIWVRFFASAEDTIA